GGLLGQTQSEYLVQSIEMADAGWEVHILSNMAEVRQQLTAFALIALLAYSSLVLF
ncbi:MAG: hypothetical protein GWN58_40600, partial [Anaerolineae bacterium]|nr:hypothetical protein [Anaerolineae bacterium]